LEETEEVFVMRYLSIIFGVLACFCFSTVASAGEKVVVPEAVVKAVNETFPNAEIEKAQMEKDSGVVVYDIELTGDRGELEVAEDGTILEVTVFIEMKDVPEAAATVIRKAASGAEIKEIEKAEARAEIKKDGTATRIVKIDNPSFVYEVELAKGGRTGELQVAPDGKIVEPLKWKPRGVKKD
jgi:uncharacterized membrane protein YkoI